MATKPAMSWIPRRKEWQKTYKGKRYRVSAKLLPCGPTKAGSLIAANDWWEKKRAEIDNNDRVTQAYNEAIDRHECMADWFGEHGDSESQRHSLQQANRLRAVLETEKAPPMPDVWEAFDGISDLGVQIWQDRIKTAQRRRKNVPNEQSISYHVEAYLASKRTEAAANEIAVSGYDRYRRHVEYFRDWVGRSNPVTAIDAVKMRDYLVHLKKQIAEREQDPRKGMARWEAKGKLDTAKQFVRSLWELGLIDLPRNINNRKYTISVGTSKPPSIPLTDAKLLLAGKTEASEVTRLYVLLCANCGMRQSDIASLQHDHVDWQRGRIRRKRSKTGTNGSVPEVDYNLWPITIELLRRYRSDDVALVLVNRNGLPLVRDTIQSNGKVSKIDNIRTAYKQRYICHFEFQYPIGLIRGTSANLFQQHEEYKNFVSYFLCHSPSSVKDRHYVTPSTEQFDKALTWLGKQYGVV